MSRYLLGIGEKPQTKNFFIRLFTDFGHAYPASPRPLQHQLRCPAYCHPLSLLAIDAMGNGDGEAKGSRSMEECA